MEEDCALAKNPIGPEGVSRTERTWMESTPVGAQDIPRLDLPSPPISPLSRSPFSSSRNLTAFLCSEFTHARTDPSKLHHPLPNIGNDRVIAPLLLASALLHKRTHLT